MKTKIFLDSGDPNETKQALDLFRFLDGQTTNPSLFAKNPEVQARLAKGEKYAKDEIYLAYRSVVEQISALLPNGTVSLEVYADKNTPCDEILRQAREMNSWIPNAHIKLPITSEALKAAQILTQEGVCLNITLIFSQEQAAAVYAATMGANKGQIYLSPFIGRLDDIGQNGMDLITNILRMNEMGDGHVEVLAASVRSFEHFLASLKYGADIITAPLKVLKQWKEREMVISDEGWQYDRGSMRAIKYEDLRLGKSWQEYNIQHNLTDIGIEKFVLDWNNLI